MCWLGMTKYLTGKHLVENRAAEYHRPLILLVCYLTPLLERHHTESHHVFLRFRCDAPQQCGPGLFPGPRPLRRLVSSHRRQ
ncbi:hypothetical protein HYQ45_015882 [Verticillium longisporum]|uniref:Uncharacterized protein n=1 Tax=Verticillium longisporum TaxID=100787 RepID=A0A8I2Z9S7_VERLO|nr:hypothetical protein HYQ45_015882 [Verticillium longisporum]